MKQQNYRKRDRRGRHKKGLFVAFVSLQKHLRYRSHRYLDHQRIFDNIPFEFK